MSYAHRWYLRAKVARTPKGVPHELQWTGTEWAPKAGKRFDSESDAREELVACCGRAPQGWATTVERETILPSREHGMQRELTGLRPFRVLPGGVVQGGSDL